jgi:phosphatidylserine/phosphatidylglycerophosphate/cardiolipin synthase-like enzyme
MQSTNSKNKFSELRRASPIYENEYDSFSDLREGNHVEILMNGKEYFKSLFDSILLAKANIYICGWAIAPELFLIRPVGKKINNYTKLMDLLSIKAQENVMIKILLYKEVPYTLPLDSAHVEKLLQSLHPNIRVRRHPNNNFSYGIWGHHEKLVIIDNTIAYIGGIDLFWGRCDDEKFELTDEKNKEDLYNFPGIDYSNDRQKDRTDLKHYNTDFIDRDTTPRMPWHDFTCKLMGPVVIDALRHFLQRWYFSIDKKQSHVINYSILYLLRRLFIFFRVKK